MGGTAKSVDTVRRLRPCDACARSRNPGDLYFVCALLFVLYCYSMGTIAQYLAQLVLCVFIRLSDTLAHCHCV